MQHPFRSAEPSGSCVVLLFVNGERNICHRRVYTPVSIRERRVPLAEAGVPLRALRAKRVNVAKPARADLFIEVGGEIIRDRASKEVWPPEPRGPRPRLRRALVKIMAVVRSVDTPAIAAPRNDFKHSLKK